MPCLGNITGKDQSTRSGTQSNLYKLAQNLYKFQTTHKTEELICLKHTLFQEKHDEDKETIYIN